MENLRTIEILNHFVEINNDRIEGYTKAISMTEDGTLKTLFDRFMQTSYKCNNELSEIILNLGGIPSKETSMTGKIFRAWMNLKVAITSNNRGAIIRSCEFGEEKAIEVYYKYYLKNTDLLSPSQQKIINEQVALIKTDHQKLKYLRIDLEKAQVNK